MQGILVRALNGLKLRFAKIQYHIDLPRKIKITGNLKQSLLLFGLKYPFF